MECSTLLEKAIENGDISQSLFKGSHHKNLILDLQKVLFELGFRNELKWDDYQADGDYGPATAKAVAAFAARNNVDSDGMSVSNALTKVLLQRHDFLPQLYLLWSIHNSDLRSRIYISKGTPVSITAVQILLNTLGYGAELQFARFGADGLYGKSTRNAVIKYARDNGIASDGDRLRRPLIDVMMKDINTFYGRRWTDLAEQNLPNHASPLAIYEGSRFIGKPCRADVNFVPLLDRINDYAEQAQVFIYVTSSFRTTTNVNGAIVPPATFSNHLAGHGIDMNLAYGNNQFANSTVLRRYPNVDPPVKKFLKSIIDDPDLRWGGNFNTKDPVHIDDGLNINDRLEWKRRYNAMQEAVQLGV